MKTVMFAGSDNTDRGLLEYARRSVGAPLEMIFVRNAPETISYLAGHSPFMQRSRYPLPEILILDLTKPRMDVWAVIDWLKTRSEFSQLHICFIGTEDDETNLSKAKAHGPCFFTKPKDVDSYTHLIGALAGMKAKPASTHQPPIHHHADES